MTDASAPLLPELNSRAFRWHERALDVALDDPVEILGGHLRDRTVSEHADAVHEDVQAAEGVQRRSHEVFAGGHLCRVAVVRDRPAT